MNNITSSFRIAPCATPVGNTTYPRGIIQRRVVRSFIKVEDTYTPCVSYMYIPPLVGLASAFLNESDLFLSISALVRNIA